MGAGSIRAAWLLIRSRTCQRMAPGGVPRGDGNVKHGFFRRRLQETREKPVVLRTAAQAAPSAPTARHQPTIPVPGENRFDAAHRLFVVLALLELSWRHASPGSRELRGASVNVHGSVLPQLRDADANLRELCSHQAVVHTGRCTAGDHAFAVRLTSFVTLECAITSRKVLASVTSVPRFTRSSAEFVGHAPRASRWSARASARIEPAHLPRGSGGGACTEPHQAPRWTETLHVHSLPQLADLTQYPTRLENVACASAVLKPVPARMAMGF